MEDIMQICSHFSSVFKVKLVFKYLWFFSYVIYHRSRLEFHSKINCSLEIAQVITG